MKQKIARKILTIGLIVGAVLVIVVPSVSAMLVKVGPHTCADMGMDMVNKICYYYGLVRC